MSKKANVKMVGLFVLIGFSCLFAIVGKFMLERITSSHQNIVVMYFQESVKGLSVGSPVVLEGVEVGKVVQIELVTTGKSMDFSIPVYVKFQKIIDVNDSSFLNIADKRSKLNDLIQHGLRARLATQSYLTGQLMIELVFQPDTPIVLKRKDQTGVLEIPTILSTIKELSQGIQRLPLKDMVDRADRVLGTLEENLPVILPQFVTLLDSMNKLTNQIDQLTKPAKEVLVKTNKTLNNANTTLSDISAASRSIKNLTDYLERHPEAILKGKEK